MPYSCLYTKHSVEALTTIVVTLVSKVEKGHFVILVTSCRVIKDDKSTMLLEPTWMGMKVAIIHFLLPSQLRIHI